MPPAPKYVLVEHTTTGVRKEVLRARWQQGLGPHWKRVPSRKKRPPAEADGSTEPAAEPDAQEE